MYKLIRWPSWITLGALSPKSIWVAPGIFMQRLSHNIGQLTVLTAVRGLGCVMKTQSQPPLNSSVASVFGQSLLHMEARDKQGLFLRYMHRSNPKTTEDRQTEDRNRFCKMYRVFIKKCILIHLLIITVACHLHSCTLFTKDKRMLQHCFNAGIVLQ